MRLAEHTGTTRGTLSQFAFAEVYAAIVDLDQLYPDFGNWFWNKVVPEIGNSRRIFTEWSDGQLAGVVIAKAEGDERKLCTVWIAPNFKKQGLGRRLMSEAKVWLGTETPLISVPHQRLSEFQPIFDQWGFSLTQTLRSYYRYGETEYVFNGTLPLLHQA